MVAELLHLYSPLQDAELYTSRWRFSVDVSAGMDTNTPSEGGYTTEQRGKQ